MKGYVQVYTGNGKGKTTASLGLALRAVGAGLKVFIGQFVKGQIYSEIKAIRESLTNITVEQYGGECFIGKNPTQKEIILAQNGLNEVRKIVSSGQYDLVILDEANIATYFKLIDPIDLLDIIQHKPDHVELVITGRNADKRIIEAADLVTEMKEVKHYYQNGVKSRKGIES